MAAHAQIRVIHVSNKGRTSMSGQLVEASGAIRKTHEHIDEDQTLADKIRSVKKEITAE